MRVIPTSCKCSTPISFCSKDERGGSRNENWHWQLCGWEKSFCNVHIHGTVIILWRLIFETTIFEILGIPFGPLQSTFHLAGKSQSLQRSELFYFVHSFSLLCWPWNESMHCSISWVDGVVLILSFCSKSQTLPRCENKSNCKAQASKVEHWWVATTPRNSRVIGSE